MMMMMMLTDEETQHQVIQQARAAAPLMKMEGVFWQGEFLLQCNTTAITMWHCWHEMMMMKKGLKTVVCCCSSGHYSSSPALVPHNHKRAVCDLTVADRLALYDHVIGALKQQQQEAVSANQDDLYVDLVSKLQKGEYQLRVAETHLYWVGVVRFTLCVCVRACVLLQMRVPVVPRRHWS